MEQRDVAPEKDSLDILLAAHRQFLLFLKPRVASPEDAEEILQTALSKALQHQESLAKETVVAWFYRVLKNAITDHYRKRDIERRAASEIRNIAESRAAEKDGLQQAVCECFRELLPALKPEYAEILEMVDLGQATLAEAGKTFGITANNAAVRLHRARLAFKKALEATCRTCADHGCFDCSCKKC